jgi:hypothetical protein
LACLAPGSWNTLLALCTKDMFSARLLNSIHAFLSGLVSGSSICYLHHR